MASNFDLVLLRPFDHLEPNVIFIDNFPEHSKPAEVVADILYPQIVPN